MVYQFFMPLSSVKRCAIELGTAFPPANSVSPRARGSWPLNGRPQNAFSLPMEQKTRQRQKTTNSGAGILKWKHPPPVQCPIRAFLRATMGIMPIFFGSIQLFRSTGNGLFIPPSIPLAEFPVTTNFDWLAGHWHLHLAPCLVPSMCVCVCAGPYGVTQRSKKTVKFLINIPL